jgi:hypothetical protein
MHPASEAASAALPPVQSKDISWRWLAKKYTGARE